MRIIAWNNRYGADAQWKMRYTTSREIDVQMPFGGIYQLIIGIFRNRKQYQSDGYVFNFLCFSRHHGGPIEGSSETIQTITVLSN